MKLFLVVFSLAIACAFGSVDFDEWKKRNDKSYQGTEKSEEEAKKAFNKTVAAIKKHNADPSATYQQGTNENSDMTDDERKKRNGYKHTSEQNKSVKKIKPKVHGTTPASYNVTSWMAPAKDQGSCGCCYEMATLSMIDGKSKYNSTKYNTKAMTFSDQHVIDCDTYDGGCDGGNPSNVFGFAYMTGLVQTANYAALTSPKTKKRGTCNKKAPIAWRLYYAGYADLTQYSLESDLKEIVYAYGPATVTMDASDTSLSSYKSGVYVPKTGVCSSSITKANHAVVITGYGTDPKTKLDYWIVRNSWGTSFGMNGYFWMKRGNNYCGIGNQVWVVL